MADFVSPIIDIISRLWPCCARHTRYLCKLQENKNLLRNAMDELKEARDDVQRRVVEAEEDTNQPKKRTDPVRGWLQRVQIIEGEVEEILKKADEQQQLGRSGRCFGGCCPPSNKCWSNYKLGKSVVKKMASVNELKENGHFAEVTYILPPSTVQDMNLESTVGMESMFDKVWRLITSTDDKVVRIMGLYGHGGVGKTTLLKKINNEFNKICGEQGFDHIVMFVVVSKPINYEAIQKTIGKRMGLSDSLKEDGDESSRADKIFNQLRNKKFVILLDDIWGRVDLQRIGIPSPPQGKSQVIFTTRNKEVCGLMEATHKFQVECLPWDKAWRLFQDKVGEEALTAFPRAPELAELVAKECGGLPLALITIGRAMSTTKSVEEWKDAITTLRNSASEFPGMGDEVLPRLKLSYDNLRNETIKSCFLYCALYPEDHSIEIAKLIDCWIAEGFLNGFDNNNNNLDEARSHGFTIIETLKRACLLEESGENEEDPEVKMHDVIRDLALWIVNGCKSNSSSHSKTTGKFLVASNNVCERWRNAERIYWRKDDGDDDGNNNELELELELEEPPRSPNLQTLMMVGGKFSLPQSFFQFTPFLRVLDLSHTRVLKFPTSICELSDLQYLSLMSTNIKELPIELRKLVKLKFLDVSYTVDLIKIPPGLIANLSELQVLKLAVSGFKDWGLKLEEDGGGGLSFVELDRLKQLQEVTLTINTSLALEELLCNQKLRTICTLLCLWDCDKIKSVSVPPSSISKGLGNLISLKDLNIGRCVELEELILFTNDDQGEINTTTTAGLLISIYNKLGSLTLHHLPRLNNIVWGEKYHHYMAAAQQQQHYLHYYVSPFQNLYEIGIWNCGALKDLKWLVYVENLKNLNVQGCEGLETIIELGDDGLEGASGGDQMLNTGGGGGGGGVFRKLKSLWLLGLPKLKSICRHALAFPSIESILILQCPELKKLPLDSGSNINNTLKWIQGKEEWWNELQWEDETIKSKFLLYYEEGSPNFFLITNRDDDGEDFAA